MIESQTAAVEKDEWHLRATGRAYDCVCVKCRQPIAEPPYAVNYNHHQGGIGFYYYHEHCKPMDKPWLVPRETATLDYIVDGETRLETIATTYDVVDDTTPGKFAIVLIGTERWMPIYGDSLEELKNLVTNPRCMWHDESEVRQ